MHQKRFFVILALITLAFMISADAYSQSPAVDGHRFEVGGQFSSLTNSVANKVDIRALNCVQAPCPPLIMSFSKSRKTQAGLGGRLGYNLTDDLALEAEFNFFPSADLFADLIGQPDDFNDGKLIQGLFGLKAGKRSKKVGIFGKTRPGFLYASKGDLEHKPDILCIAIFPNPQGCYQTKSQNSFALDVGGVVELYPAKRTIIRFDVGDTIVRLGTRGVTAVVSNGMSGAFLGVPAETTHNFQGSIGIGYRF